MPSVGRSEIAPRPSTYHRSRDGTARRRRRAGGERAKLRMVPVPSEPGRRNDREEIHRQEDPDGGQRGTGDTGDEVSDKRHGNDDRAGRDQRHGNRVKKLLLGEPPHVVDHTLLEKWHDGQPAPEDKRPRLGEEQQNLQQDMLVSGGR